MTAAEGREESVQSELSMGFKWKLTHSRVTVAEGREEPVQSEPSI